MSTPSNNRATDMRGAGKLAIDAILGVTDIVESLHRTIAGGAAIEGEPARTSGITGMVYKNVRTITKASGNGIDYSLNRLGSTLGETESSTRREAIVSALNGVLGDHLVSKGNPLAIPMRLRRDGLPLSPSLLSEVIQESNGRLTILVHGSCMNDLAWDDETMARELDITPIYLHYNTGLHISENGRQFAELLETIVNQSPQPIEIQIIAHSMGGLVSRSACHYGKMDNHNWLMHLQKIVFLGTPHQGALLEKGGNWIDIILESNAYSAPFSRLGKIRSSGITDLRYGNIIDEDWMGRDKFEFSGDQRTSVPLPDDVDCYTIAAVTGNESSKLNDDLIGDGLVTLGSALGRHKRPEFALSFPETNQWISYNMNHIDLLNHPEVYEVMKNWLKS